MQTLCNCGSCRDAINAVEKEVKLLAQSDHCPLWTLQIAAAWQCAALSLSMSIVEEKPEVLTSLGKKAPTAIAAGMLFEQIVDILREEWNSNVTYHKTH